MAAAKKTQKAKKPRVTADTTAAATTTAKSTTADATAATGITATSSKTAATGEKSYRDKRVDRILNQEPTPAATWVSCVGTLLALSFLIIDQGGFFSSSCASTGIVAIITAALVLILRRRLPTLQQMIPSLILLALSLIELVSTAVNGPCVTSLLEALRWASLAPLALCCTLLPARIRGLNLKDLLAWFFIAWSILGLLIYTQLLPLDGAMDGRLQFTFSYANASAVFFAVGVLLCISSETRRLRGLACIPLSTLLATQSGGGIGIFLLVCLGLTVYALVTGSGNGTCRGNTAGKDRGIGDGDVSGATLRIRLVSLAGQGLFMVVSLALAVKCTVWALPIGVCIAAIVFAYAPWSDRFVAHLDSKKILAGIAALAVIAAAAVAAVVLPDRLAESTATFAERLGQMSDGLSLFATAPLLGVGPDLWRFLFADIQTTYYEVNIVHCSLVQIALDGGLLALLAYAAFYALSLVRAIRIKQPFALAICLMATLHLLVDFDLRFGALILLLPLTLAAFDTQDKAQDKAQDKTQDKTQKEVQEDEGGESKRAFSPAACGAITAAVLIASTAACVCALWINSAALAVSYAASMEKAAAALESNDLIKNDVGCNETYLLSALKKQDYPAILAWAETNEPRIPLQAAYLYMALQNTNQQDKADELLAIWKERAPYASVLDVLK